MFTFINNVLLQFTLFGASYFTSFLNLFSFSYLREALHVVDARRIAVWGWSYGGFVSAMLLSSPNQDVFHCAIAVAPVTSWKLYGNFSKRSV